MELTILDMEASVHGDVQSIKDVDLKMSAHLIMEPGTG